MMIRDCMLHRPARLLAILLMLAGSPAMAATEGERPWSAELHAKRYFGSHTSFEFGNPFPPYQAPLSRLEFPMDAWWAGGEFRRSFSRYSVGVEVLRNVSRKTDGSMKDSDWDAEEDPKLRTIYSESSCRMEPSYMVRGDLDLKVADWLELPDGFDLRPVVGVRWQRVKLVTHDGVQTYAARGDNPPPDPLPGDGIRFEQTYWHYFLGIRAAYDLERHFKRPRLKLLCQLDWAYVEADNSDRHLLRQGNRMTYEKTHGYAWHASLGLKAGLTKNMNAGVEMEYLRIQTKGEHRLVNELFDIDFTLDNGVKVWSEQKSLMLNLEYLF